MSELSCPMHVLRRRNQFLAVKKGERRKGKLFLLEFLFRNDDNPVSRVGFTVTKKEGNAVERNRIRRRLREAVRLHAIPLMQSGFDYVLIGRREILQTSFQAIRAELSQRIAQSSITRTRNP